MPGERVKRRIESLLDEAESAVARQDWAVVRDRATTVLTLDPSDADARVYLEAANRGLAATGRPSTTPPTDNFAVATSGPTQPSSFANSRYIVKKFLGEGGKKRVYLAHDTTLDRDVAFALIKSEALDDAARKRILREAQAMGRLGDHPNIVPIHDLGTENGQPYMVLPLMQGGDLEGLIDKAEDRRPALDHVLRVAKDVCEGLVFAHSKGIVHRDLKPGNVWLTERGQAKIGDFGLALPLDQSRLTREGFMVGTVAYMPPEQAMGGEITTRADLYSLGAMLYEVVTGRPPFLGDDDIAIIGQHINTPPVAPTWHSPQCPKPLEALIMRLLAKDPAQRPESANDVLFALAAIDTRAAAVPSTATPAPQSHEGRSLESMSSGVFVGRHKEMDQLRAALEEVLSGHGRMVTLVGEPGIGKTRTAQELATYAGLRRCQVLWGRCYEGGGAPPYWPWVQAIRQYVQEREPDQLKREMGSTASVIAEIVQDVRDKILGIASPPQLDSPESSRFRLFDAVATFLKNASRTQSLVLVLDDLHWADKPSLMLLEFVARELAGSRTLLTGTYRDVELNRRHPLAVTLGDLTKERLFERVLLRGLRRDDVARFIELAAGSKPAAPLVEAVYTQTEGNPLFVTEVVRLLVQEGEFAREKAGDRGRKTTTWIVRIPEGVKEVIGRRLDRLSGRCNDLLTTASVIGRQFSLPALARLYADPALSPEERITEDRILDLIEEALAARIIEELPSGPGRYQFTHALIEEALAAELSTTRKVRLHARIAQTLEALYAKHESEHAAELARHFSEAETVLGAENVIRYSMIAGESAISSFAYEEAVRHFERALAAKGQISDAQAGRILFGLGRARAATAVRADIQAAVDTVRSAFDLHLTLGDQNGALAVALFPFPHFHGTRGVTELMERALPLAPPNSREAARILSRLAMFASMEHGEFRQDILQAASAIAHESADPTLRVHVLNVSGQLNFFHRNFSAALDASGAALALLPRISDVVTRLETLGHASAYRFNVAFASARETVSAELAIADQRFRGRHQHRWANGNFGWIAARTGEWKEGLARIEEGLESDPDEYRLLIPLINIHLDLGTAEKILDRIRHAISVRGVGLQWLFVDRFEEIAEVIGHPDALRAFEEIAQEPRSSLEPIWIDSVDVDLAAHAILTGNMDEARSRYSRLAESVLCNPMHFIRRRPALPRIAHALGDIETAVRLHEEATAYWRREGARAELARWLHTQATLLYDRNADRDRERALKMWDESLTIASALGMKPLIERVIARKQLLKA